LLRPASTAALSPFPIITKSSVLSADHGFRWRWLGSQVSNPGVPASSPDRKTLTGCFSTPIKIETSFRLTKLWANKYEEIADFTDQQTTAIVEKPDMKNEDKRMTLISGLVASSLALSAPAFAEGEVVFSSWGGSFQDALRSAMLDPAAKKLGITIKEDTTNGIADVRAQITAGAVAWDITEQALADCARLKQEGALETIDYGVVSTDGIPTSLVDNEWVGLLTYSLVIGWQAEKFGENGPQSWADFWDTDKHPGTRAMFNSVSHALEAALMADGVAPADVNTVLRSEGGVDRAFAKLEEIAPDVVVWYRGGSQAAQLMADKEVDFIHIGNGRAEALNADGATVGYTWNQATTDADCLLVPKGAPNRDNAMLLLNEMLSAEAQARMAVAISYGPVNAKAFETGLISPELAATNNASPDNMATQVVIDASFYVENFAELQERFDTLIQQ
jgi:putative spermidine/putrescine transport system substrate-binding protein